MKGVQSVGEALELGIILTIFVAGLNALWGILLLPWGVVGVAFSLVDILITFYVKKVKIEYAQGDYEDARAILRILWPFGVVFGIIFLGIYLYLVYSTLEELWIKTHLIRNVEELPTYVSPKIPQKRG